MHVATFLSGTSVYVYVETYCATGLVVGSAKSTHWFQTRTVAVAAGRLSYMNVYQSSKAGL